MLCMLSATCLSLPCTDPRPAASATALRAYFLWPLLVLAVVAGLWMVIGGDLRLADTLYRAQGGQWTLRHAWWFQEVLHHSGQRFSQWLGVGVFLALMFSCGHARFKHWRKPLVYLFLAVGLSAGLVSLLKHLTQMDCPWDLQRYGGIHPFVGLLESRPAALGRAVCFPAGHASSGYAWLALYFFALRTRPRWRWWGLGIGLATGAVFGFTQQLRGAHFLSHDLATLAICWCVAAGLFMCMFRFEEPKA